MRVFSVDTRRQRMTSTALRSAMSALTRRLGAGELTAMDRDQICKELATDLRDMHVIALDEPVVARAAGLVARHSLRTLDAIQKQSGAIAALPLSDSLKRASDDGKVVAGAVARQGLWRAQTPQCFRYSDILAAHRAGAGQGP